MRFETLNRLHCASRVQVLGVGLSNPKSPPRVCGSGLQVCSKPKPLQVAWGGFPHTSRQMHRSMCSGMVRLQGACWGWGCSAARWKPCFSLSWAFPANFVLCNSASPEPHRLDALQVIRTIPTSLPQSNLNRDHQPFLVEGGAFSYRHCPTCQGMSFSQKGIS